MSEKDQETQANIIAEMRMGKPVGPCAYRIGLPDKEEVYESGARMRTIQIKDVTVQELADRLEAAAKREKAQPGNAAAMHEALELFVEYSELVCRMGMFNRDRLVAITTKAKVALSEPARNCDRQECAQINGAAKVWYKEEIEPRVKGLTMGHKEMQLPDWLLAPIAQLKGEGDGK